jgi:hypothetical protein
MSDDDETISMSETLEQTMAELRAVALKVKAERDMAVKLLSEAMIYSAAGERGDFKTRVRNFLETLKGK